MVRRVLAHRGLVLSRAGLSRVLVLLMVRRPRLGLPSALQVLVRRVLVRRVPDPLVYLVLPERRFRRLVCPERPRGRADAASSEA